MYHIKIQRKNSHIFGISYGWLRGLSIQIKGNAHHTIHLVHNCDGLPPVYIVDGALEFVQG